MALTYAIVVSLSKNNEKYGEKRTYTPCNQFMRTQFGGHTHKLINDVLAGLSV